MIPRALITVTDNGATYRAHALIGVMLCWFDADTAAGAVDGLQGFAGLAQLIPAIWEAVDGENTAIVTDEFNAYSGVGRRVSGGHHTTKHSAREYARGWVHSNTAESVFSLLKRGIIGTYHSVSKAHLPGYLAEFEYRWNTRKMDDGERVSRLIRQSEGKRLTYADSVVRKVKTAL